MIRVLPIIINPTLTNDGQTLVDIYGGRSRVESLISEHCEDLNDIFQEDFFVDWAHYEKIDFVPVKQDGFMYTSANYLAAVGDSQQHHEPDLVNYWDFIDKFHLIQRKLDHEFDEVHVWGGPWMGFHESQMIGMGSVFCNSGPIVASCPKFVLMGYNYERGTGEALESVAHRAESIFQYRYPKTWNYFKSEVGTVHKPFNGVQDYDWSNKSYALFSHRGTTQVANCDLWGCDGLGYLKWWFAHMDEYVRHDVIHLEDWN
jgi:hypothetical protein